MRIFLLVIFAVCLVVLPLRAETRFSPEQAELLQDGLIATADDFILPSYSLLAGATDDMSRALDAYCSGAGALSVVHDAYEISFLAWQRASIIQVGPVMDAEGPMRFQLWPDPKGFSRRAVRAAIRAENLDLVAQEGLDGRSIALVNLSTLEVLLYGDLSPATYACSLASAISRYQAKLSAQLVAAWGGGSLFRADYDTALRGNERYATIDEVIRELLAGVVVYTDRLRKFKIQRGLGAKAGQARKERTEAVASGLGLKSIEVSFRAIADLYLVSDGLFDVTPDLGATMEHQILAYTARNIADALRFESASLADIADEDGKLAQDLRNFGELTIYHEDYLKLQLPQSIGLTTGFTSADGD